MHFCPKNCRALKIPPIRLPKSPSWARILRIMLIIGITSLLKERAHDCIAPVDYYNNTNLLQQSIDTLNKNNKKYFMEIIWIRKIVRYQSQLMRVSW